MTRHTTFKFRLDPTGNQHEALARHAGAARFAFNQCLAMVKSALTARQSDPHTDVPWTRFDLINAFNAWKLTPDAGRVFVVDSTGAAESVVTGLSWRSQIYQQVFEESASDLGRALQSWLDSRSGKRQGKALGFPRFKKNARVSPSFRMRNKQLKSRPATIRIGDNGHPRSITLPRIGRIGICDDTRKLRRMLTKGRAKILFASVTYRAGRWWVSVNVEAEDLHSSRRHPNHEPGDSGGWVGIDLGLSAFLVAATADGDELARITNAPKALPNQLQRLRRLAKSLSHKEKGSNNGRDAAAKLARHHQRIANVRRHFLHQVSNELAPFGCRSNQPE